MNNLSGLCRIRYRVFLVKTLAFVLTVQWAASPPVAICYTVHRIVFYLRNKILE
jgi:uncharacterized membrane protein